MKLSTLFFITLSVISMGANAHGPTPKKADKRATNLRRDIR